MYVIQNCGFLLKTFYCLFLKEEISLFLIASECIFFLLFLCILQNGINCAYFHIFSPIASRNIPCWIYGYGFLFSSYSSLRVCLSYSKLLWGMLEPPPAHLKDLISFSLQKWDWRINHGLFKSCISYQSSMRMDASMMEMWNHKCQAGYYQNLPRPPS